MIRFKCSQCGQTIKAKDGSAGKRSKCPGCRAPLTVPGNGVSDADVLGMLGDRPLTEPDKSRLPATAVAETVANPDTEPTTDTTTTVVPSPTVETHVHVHQTTAHKSKMAGAVLAFFLGHIGIHNFYLGRTGPGVTQLLLTLLTCGFGLLITIPWAWIDVILILTGGIRDGAGQELR